MHLFMCSEVGCSTIIKVQWRHLTKMSNCLNHETLGKIPCFLFLILIISCIAPLRYCSDFRPYFTIHDSEFKEYTTRTQAPWVSPCSLSYSQCCRNSRLDLNYRMGCSLLFILLDLIMFIWWYWRYSCVSCLCPQDWFVLFGAVLF